ncbi:hypothetical protein TNCV_2267461 [Trichonephila clavipes]|nr:hypothetical protein TNCV_2267461 [Trichonephila clavipes]
MVATMAPLRVVSLILPHNRFRLDWCRAQNDGTTTEWNRVVFRNLGSDDNRLHVYRHLVQWHTTSITGVMVGGDLASIHGRL